jgi:hypothetical protein
VGVRRRYQWERRGSREKRGRRVNMVQKMSTHVRKCKMIPVETTPGMRGGSEKAE